MVLKGGLSEFCGADMLCNANCGSLVRAPCRPAPPQDNVLRHGGPYNILEHQIHSLCRVHFVLRHSTTLQMSGIEVIGLLLGVFPLVISTFEHYRDCHEAIGVLFRFEDEYKNCLNDVKDE